MAITRLWSWLLDRGTTWRALGVATILAMHWLLGFNSLSNKSPAYDEPIHLTGGYSYWRFNDYRLHPENGNLPQRVAALPLLFLPDVQFPSRDQADWRNSQLWNISDQFLFGSNNNVEQMLACGHAISALFGVGICLVVYLWSRQLFGEWGGLVSLVSCAFSPTLLAQAPLITSDACTAFFFTVSVWTIWQVLQTVTLPRVTMSSLAVAGLFLSKTSAVLILPMAMAMVGGHFLSGQRLVLRLAGTTRVVQSVRGCAWIISVLTLVYAVVSWVAIWTAFGWRYSAVAPDSTEGHKFYGYGTLDSAAGGAGKVGSAILLLAEGRVLPEAWLYGTAYVLTSSQRRAFFNGDYSLRGWWGYFPYCALVKTELSLLGLLLASAWAAVARRRQDSSQPAESESSWRGFVPLLVLLAVYWIAALFFTMAIGHRHLLPTYPALYILAGGAARWLDRQYPLRCTLVALLLAVSVGESLRVHPHYLSYFNQFIARKSAFRHLVDSNLDWGQDLPLLKTWLDDHGATEGEHPAVFLGYFGRARPAHYGIRAVQLQQDGSQTAEAPLRGGVYCISATFVQSVQGLSPGHWNQEYERIYREATQKMQLYQAMDPATVESLREGHDPEYLSAVGAYESLRVSRLMSYLRHREPEDHVGFSILIYRLSDRELDLALTGPPKEFGPEATFLREITTRQP